MSSGRKSHEEENTLIYRLLEACKIYDIYITHTKEGNIILIDDEKNIWKGKAAYDFLFEEVFCCNGLLGQGGWYDEYYKKLEKYRKQYIKIQEVNS